MNFGNEEMQTDDGVTARQLREPSIRGLRGGKTITNATLLSAEQEDDKPAE